LLAGSVGGAIGVGVAYPFDTLKTKSQVYKSPEDDLISLVKLILEVEGIGGFFGGVKAMMIGQALIKSVAFSANELALGALHDNEGLAANDVAAAGVVDGGDGAVATSFVTLLLAASFSGFVTSFLVAPVERVKVMMQAQQDATYANEIECIKAVLENEGWTGLFSRGLGPTLAREIPSYGIYFVVYGVLMQTTMAQSLGSVAPLVFGAMSGCACWIPVYPIDVVKTLVQNTEGGDSANSIEVAVQLYNEEGIGAFFNGLTPKMIRASVNHAVTFFVYDLMMDAL
ncbi:mitochondrial carrier protein, partial [Thalassiosira pseudonana CCMP1335]